MDERILTILKEVAYGEDCCDDMGHECLYCSGNEDYSPDQIDDIIHKSECPIMLARDLLREMGTPLKLYKITYNRVLRRSPPYPVQVTRLGYTENEIKQQFEMPVFTNEKWENIQIEYIKDL